MTELLLGIVCGLALSLFFSFGPSFFAQIRTSLQYGFKRSYFFAFGVNAGDVIIIFLMLTVLKNADLYGLLHNVWVASIAAVVMVMMGVVFYKKRVETLESFEEKSRHIKFKSKDGEPSRMSVFFQGFLLNFVNPTIWIYWVSVIAIVSGELNLTVVERYVFFLGIIGTTLGMDILKCKLASMLQRIITANFLNVANKVCSIILFAFAAYLVVSMVIYQTKSTGEEVAQPKGPRSTEMIKNIHDRMDSSITKGMPGDTIRFNGKRSHRHKHI